MWCRSAESGSGRARRLPWATFILLAVALGCGSSPDRVERLAGCQPEDPSYRDGGLTGRRAVALTFADGPGPYTGAVLEILEGRHVPGTFFVVGRRVRGREALMRRALAQGNALGNHSFTHSKVPGAGYDEIRRTQAAVRGATGYTPCVFRPPHGAAGKRLLPQARSLGLNTIGGGFDSGDWREPGSGAIYRRVVSLARSDAVILMHDAGGKRAQTVAALPRIITTLRSRGYRFLTVPQLLGLRPRFKAPDSS
jgi:peptidoglycan/xylan/chitin deacetylase (PgdA/CDA1 family)